MLEGLSFYAVQILAGLMLGTLTAAVGVFVLLRRFTIFGVTLAQGATAAVALTLLLGLRSHEGRAGFGGDLLVLAFTTLAMSPLYPIMLRTSGRRTAILVVGFVFFAAIAQVFVAMGGDVQNHLLAAFFGNILTTPSEEIRHIWPVVLVVGVAFVFFYRDLLSLSLDPDHARLSGVRVVLVEAVFFMVLAITTAQAINLMGSFYTLTQMILPGLFALAICRSVPAAVAVAVLYSALGTLFGFALSLQPVTLGSRSLNLPTSSTIILLMCAGLLLLPAFKWLSARTSRKSGARTE